MIQTNKNFSPGPDRITPELVLNGEKNLVTALTILMQASYQLGYFLQPWKKENRIYLKKPEKSSNYVPSSYISIPLTNSFGKIFERVILQETVNTLTENKFFEGKNVYACQKHKNAPQALLPFLEQMSEAMSSGKYGVVVANAGLRRCF